MKINRKTYEKLLEESQRLVDQGFDQDLVIEGLGDFFTGGLGGEVVTQTLKGQFMKSILNTLGIVDSDSFLGLALQNLFANISFKDYSRLGDCSFVAPQLTKAILETFIDKMRIQAGMDSILFTAIKETLTEAGSNTAAFRSLQKYVSSFICPVISKISSNFDFSAFSGK
jgi:hypothetical protein